MLATFWQFTYLSSENSFKEGPQKTKAVSILNTVLPSGMHWLGLSANSTLVGLTVSTFSVATANAKYKQPQAHTVHSELLLTCRKMQRVGRNLSALQYRE